MRAFLVDLLAALVLLAVAFLAAAAWAQPNLGINLQRVQNAPVVTMSATDAFSGETVVPVCAGNDKLTRNGGGLVCAADQTGAGSGYATIRDNGVAETQRTQLNILSGTNISATCADDAVTPETDCTFALSGTHGDAFHADSYSGVGSCGAGSAVTATVDNAGPTCDANAAFDDESNTFTVDQQFSGKVSVGTATAPVGTLMVRSQKSDSTLPATWDSNWSTFGGTTTTAGAFALAYDSTNNRCLSACETPGVALRDWRFHALNYVFTDGAASPAVVATISNAGKAQFVSSVAPFANLGVLANVTSNAPTAWGSHAVFGGTTTTSAAIGISYNTSSDRGQIMSLAPNSAWKPMDFLASNWAFVNSSSSTVATISSTGLGAFNGGVTIGTSATNITKHISATASLDYTFAGAGITCQDLTITVTGATTSDTVVVGIPAALASSAGVVFSEPWVSAANTVTLRGCDVTSSNVNPAAATVRADVWQH